MQPTEREIVERLHSLDDGLACGAPCARPRPRLCLLGFGAPLMHTLYIDRFDCRPAREETAECALKPYYMPHI